MRPSLLVQDGDYDPGKSVFMTELDCSCGATIPSGFFTPGGAHCPKCGRYYRVASGAHVMLREVVSKASLRRAWVAKHKKEE